LKVCIVAKDEDVEKVRETAFAHLENFRNHSNVMVIPLSESGEGTPTHWFCTFEASQPVFEKMKTLQNLSDIEEVKSVKDFLKARNLKMINPRDRTNASNT
jgi:hypothetical protein